jgi:hypothetical protein
MTVSDPITALDADPNFEPVTILECLRAGVL